MDLRGFERVGCLHEPSLARILGAQGRRKLPDKLPPAIADGRDASPSHAVLECGEFILRFGGTMTRY